MGAVGGADFDAIGADLDAGDAGLFEELAAEVEVFSFELVEQELGADAEVEDVGDPEFRAAVEGDASGVVVGDDRLDKFSFGEEVQAQEDIEFAAGDVPFLVAALELAPFDEQDAPAFAGEGEADEDAEGCAADDDVVVGGDGGLAGLDDLGFWEGAVSELVPEGVGAIEAFEAAGDLGQDGEEVGGGHGKRGVRRLG